VKPMTKIMDSISNGSKQQPLAKLRATISPKLSMVTPKQGNGKGISKPLPPPIKNSSICNIDDITIPEADNGKLIYIYIDIDMYVST
jgi:hypothetical protein